MKGALWYMSSAYVVEIPVDEIPEEDMPEEDMPGIQKCSMSKPGGGKSRFADANG